MHVFVQVNNSSIFESGDVNGILKAGSIYHNDIMPERSAQPGLMLQDATRNLSPPNGGHQSAAWDNRVQGVFKRLVDEVNRANVPYHARHVNSNTFVALGLHRLGFSQAQIEKLMTPRSSSLNNPGQAIGISTADQNLLESELDPGGGFDYSSSGGGGNPASGFGANHAGPPY